MKKQSNKSKLTEYLLSAPSMLWLIVLFLLPTLIIFVIAFKPPTINGGIGDGWTLDTIRRMSHPAYPGIIWRTIWISVLTTAICLFLSLPVAYWMSRVDAKLRRWAILLIIVPFWINFLIRIFAWKTLLHPEGWFKSFLLWLHLVEPNTQLLYNSGAILLVLVYSYLPFSILPLYAAAEKFDFSLIDAARDLGAGRLRAFFSVFVPGVRQGILTAVLMVLIPALGSYAIPDIVGGTDSEMIGNKIAQRALSDRNLPYASALSACLALAVLMPMVIGMLVRNKSRKAVDL